MTHQKLPRAENDSDWFLPAWMFSFLLHASAILLMGLVMQHAPRGGASFDGDSAGIVLDAASSKADLFDGEEETNDAHYASDSAASGGASDAPPVAIDVLSVLPAEPLPPAASEDIQREPFIDRGESSSSATVTPVAASQPDAGQFTKGGGRRAGRLGTGHGYAEVSVFGVKGEGNKFVYLFDRSSSMEGAPLAAAKRQLLQSLESLDSVHQFHIVFFNTATQSFDITGGGRRIAFATDRNKRLAANFLDGITADGGTDRLSALKHAIGFAPDVIFFLTDADDPLGPGELADIAEANSRSHAAICVIEFGRRQSPPYQNFLMELARQSGGQYGYVNTMTLGK